MNDCMIGCDIGLVIGYIKEPIEIKAGYYEDQKAEEPKPKSNE